VPNLTRVSRGSICLSSPRCRRRRRRYLSFFLSPSFPRSIAYLSVSLPSKRAARRSPFRLRGFAHAFIMHAKFHAEALRLASNPLITRCLRAPACARARALARSLARSLRLHAGSGSSVCARLYLKAPESTRCRSFRSPSRAAAPCRASSLAGCLPTLRPFASTL